MSEFRLAISGRTGVKRNKGIFVGIAAVPTTDTPFLMLKPIKKSLEMVRVILEQQNSAKNLLIREKFIPHSFSLPKKVKRFTRIRYIALPLLV